MSSKLSRNLIAVLIVLIFTSSLDAQSLSPRLSRSRIVAMIAGGVTDEDITHEIRQRGLAFHSDSQYLALIKGEGGGATVIAALRDAKADDTEPAGQDTGKSIQHLANSSQFIDAKNYVPAAQELDAALQSGAPVEAGFVMGRLLVEQNLWPGAAEVYAQVLQLDPNFADAHVKLSFVLYKLGETDMALSEAQSALAQLPDNAEAHKNKGLVLESLQKYEFAEKEYREALRIKPNYSIPHEDLGILYDDWGKLDESVSEFKKALALNPPDTANVHYNLGDTYDKEDQIDSAIREYREAKRLDPSRIDVRENLAVTLSRRDSLAGIKEFNELIAMAPDFALAHAGVADAMLFRADYQGAEAESRKAIQLDPSDPDAFVILGQALEEQGRYDDATQTYLKAQSLDQDNAAAHRLLGRTYFKQQLYVKAIGELKIATHLAPSNSEGHDLLGRSLQSRNNSDDAISEYREALKFDPHNNLIMSRLAPLIEKKGDAQGALELYGMIAEMAGDAESQRAFADAQKRLKDQSAAQIPVKNAPTALRSPRRQIPAGQLESVWKQALADGNQEMSEGKLRQGEEQLQYALSLAEKLVPHDQRLMDSEYSLGLDLLRENKISEGRTLLERAVTLGVEISGESLQIAPSLDILGDLAVVQKDYSSAETYYMRALDLHEKFMGPGNTMVAMDLTRLGTMYEQRKAYDKAEPLLLRALTISDTLSQGAANFIAESYVVQVQNLYLTWENYDKAEPYARRILAMREREYGDDSKMALSELRTLTDILIKLGRTDEANSLSKRSAAIAAETPSGINQ